VVRLAYPLLDSFPPIFAMPEIQPDDEAADNGDDARERRNNTGLTVHSLVTTTNSIIPRLAHFKEQSRFADITEREELYSAFSDTIDAYKEGWDSGSDDDEDFE
jgi:hypothetical protein